VFLFLYLIVFLNDERFNFLSYFQNIFINSIGKRFLLSQFYFPNRLAMSVLILFYSINK